MTSVITENTGSIGSAVDDAGAVAVADGKVDAERVGRDPVATLGHRLDLAGLDDLDDLLLDRLADALQVLSAAVQR